MLLDLLQLADSAFPTGSFAHSLGLESLLQDEVLELVVDGEAHGPERALEQLLRARIAVEFARVDLPLLVQAHACAARNDAAALVAINQLALAVRPVREWRLAGARTGRALLGTVAEFLPDSLLSAMMDRSTGDGIQLSVAFGLAAQRLGCPARASAEAYAYAATAGQLAAGVRLGILGSRAAQRILHALKPLLATAVAIGSALSPADIGGGLPLVEIAGMRHEHAPERLFAS